MSGFDPSAKLLGFEPDTIFLYRITVTASTCSKFVKEINSNKDLAMEYTDLLKEALDGNTSEKFVC